MKLVHIRSVQEADDFEVIYQLINTTMVRFSGTESVSYAVSGEVLKKRYCDLKSPNKAFVAISENKIIAFMGVLATGVTKNGLIECGFSQEYEDVLDQLLSKCIASVQGNGGTRIYIYSPIQFGQVRNEGIRLWEKLGFISDEYSYVTTILNLDNWIEPQSFNLSGIEPSMEMNYEQIKQILLEDGEDDMASLFHNQFSQKKTMNQVILTLKDETSNDISAIAYYRVNLMELDKEDRVFEATAFGIHVRPQFSLNKDEIRRFVQGALISMKQLDVQTVISRITLKNFSVFAALISEGFHNEGLEKANTIRLYKEI